MPMSLDARWQLFDCQTAASNADIIRCTLAVVWLSQLHSMSMSSNTLTKLSVIRTAAFDAEIIECIDDFVWIFEMLKTQQLSVDVNETFNVCWSCRLIDWLQNKLLIDKWRKLNVKLFAFIDCERFFSFTDDFFFRFFRRFSNCKRRYRTRLFL